MAWHYKAYVREQEPRDRLALRRRRKRRQGLEKGLWSRRGAQPLWEFRRTLNRRATGLPEAYP